MREVPVAFDRLVLERCVEMYSCKKLSSDGRSLDQVAGWLRGKAFTLGILAIWAHLRNVSCNPDPHRTLRTSNADDGPRVGFTQGFE